MDPGEFAGAWFFLIWTLGEKKILNPFDRKYLRVVEISDHPVVLEIFEQKGQPLRSVRAHAEIDNPIMNLGIDFNVISLRLGGDRLPGSSSPILCDLIL